MIMQVITDIIVMSTPILLAGLGGLYTHLGGKLNIGLEGMILLGALFSGVFAHLSGNLLVGIAGGIGVASGFSVLMILLSFKARANIFVLGLATNLFAVGFCQWVGEMVMGTRGTVFFVSAPRLDRMVLGLNGIDMAAVISVFVSWFILYRMPYGFHLRATGADHKTAQSVGISPFKATLKAYLLCGVLCGMAGASLSLPIQSFVGGMSSGRGWIALVAVILSKGHPLGVLITSLVFGSASYLSHVLQAMTDYPPKLLLALPFVVTLISMLVFSKSRVKEVIH